MGIRAATIQPAATGADPAALLAGACQGAGGLPPVPPPAPTDPADIGPARYLDDRSDPVQVVRSLYNAVSRREYARAYAYWQATDQGAVEGSLGLPAAPVDHIPSPTPPDESGGHPRPWSCLTARAVSFTIRIMAA
ncbi:MAG: hypothetical protein IT340_19540 [Chloroflexi bacterium]|nr:hypothetical protein [Chloroflexota bacterium]